MKLIQRDDYLSKIRPFMGTDLIKVITGMRRSGKSSLMQLIQDDLHAQGCLKSSFITYNFELEKNYPLQKPGALYKELSDAIKTAQKKLSAESSAGDNTATSTPFELATVHIFLDEIQAVPEWERALTSLRLEFECDIYITGSNAQMLSSELSSKLAGRYVEFQVQPFSFSEFIQSYTQSSSNSSKHRYGQSSSNHPTDASLQELFQKYITFGGMPYLGKLDYEQEPCQQYLRDTFLATQLKDIVARYNIRNVDLLDRILHYAYESIGQPFSANSIGRYFKHEGRQVSVESILNYLQYATSAYVLFEVPRANLKGKETLSAGGKYYVADLGIREALYKNNQRDLAQVLENLVYLELRRQGWQVAVGSVSAKEVDFVATRGDQTHYYQVSYLLADQAVIDREFSSLLEIKDNFPKYVLSLDEFDFSREGIQHKNLCEWLLNPE